MNNVNLHYLALGMNTALAVHFGIRNDLYWTIFSLVIMAVNLLSIYLLNKYEDRL
jgi:hypothetical protein